MQSTSSGREDSTCPPLSPIDPDDLILLSALLPVEPPRPTCRGRRLAGVAAVTFALIATTVAGQEPEAEVPAGPAAPAEEIAVPSAIGPDDVRPHVEYLAHPDRLGRQGEGLAAAGRYIEQQFRQQKLRPLFGDSFRQEIPDGSGDPMTPPLGTNIGAVLPGSDAALRDEYILVTAHYDHLGVRRGVVYPGADDNATGVAMMLECARQLAVSPARPRRSIAFVAFDLEERLLYGSRWFAAHPPWNIRQVKLFITADMLGRSLGDLPLPAVFVMGSERSDEVRRLLDRLRPPDGLELARIGGDIVGTRSDYGPFRDYRIPFLFFSTGEHPDYHTPRDTPDRVDFAKCARISNVILSVTRAAADAAQAPQWQADPPRDIGEVATILRVTDLLLDSESNGERTMSDLQRAFVTQVNAKARYIVKRGRISGEERVWLARAAQILLYSMF